MEKLAATYPDDVEAKILYALAVSANHDLKDKTLISVGRMGQGPPLRPTMPPGLWGMREVQIEVLRKSAPSRIRITHRNETLNQILRSVRVQSRTSCRS
jgi:hypothetical protein